MKLNLFILGLFLATALAQQGSDVTNDEAAIDDTADMPGESQTAGDAEGTADGGAAEDETPAETDDGGAEEATDEQPATDDEQPAAGDGEGTETDDDENAATTGAGMAKWALLSVALLAVFHM